MAAPELPAPPLDAKVATCLASLSAWRASLAPETLSPLATAFLNEATTLRRYAVARNGDLAAAKTALQATLAWREAHITTPLGCERCPGDPYTHCFHTLGATQPTPAAPAGCVLVYACAARAKQNESADAVRHMVHTLEHAWAAPGVTADRLCVAGGGCGAGAAFLRVGRASRGPLPLPSSHTFPWPPPPHPTLPPLQALDSGL